MTVKTFFKKALTAWIVVAMIMVVTQACGHKGPPQPPLLDKQKK